jgi:hypothetical protein
MLGVFWAAEQLLTVQRGLSSMVLVLPHKSWFIIGTIKFHVLSVSLLFLTSASQVSVDSWSIGSLLEHYMNPKVSPPFPQVLVKDINLWIHYHEPSQLLTEWTPVTSFRKNPASSLHSSVGELSPCN